MRIIYFSQDYTTHDHRFLKKLSLTDHDVFFLRLENRGLSLDRRKCPSNIQEIEWEGGKTVFSYRNILRYYFSLKKVINKYKPDVIHAGPIQTVTFLTTLTHFQPIVGMSWGSDLLIDSEKSFFMKKITEFTLKRCTVLIADCNAVAKKAISFGLSQFNIVKFPWGVDLTNFRPNHGNIIRQKLEWNKNFVIISVRSWEPIYGIDVLIKAFNKLVHKYPFVRLLLLGKGSLNEVITSYIKQEQISDYIHLGGQVPQDKLPDYYNSADVYVSTSYSDGSSVSLLEALASGRPAVVSDIPGNREWVNPGITGWLFIPGNINDLIQKIERLIETKDRLSEMGNKSRILAEEKADWNKNSRKLMLAYQLAIQEKHEEVIE